MMERVPDRELFFCAKLHRAQIEISLKFDQDTAHRKT